MCVDGIDTPGTPSPKRDNSFNDGLGRKQVFISEVQACCNTVYQHLFGPFMRELGVNSVILTGPFAPFHRVMNVVVRSFARLC